MQIDGKADSDKPKSSKGSIILILMLLALIAWIYSGFSSGEKHASSQVKTTESNHLATSTQAKPKDTALDKMNRVFVGNPSVSVIKSAIAPVMKMYGTPVSEDGYSRAGSALVTMRKESGVTELELLRCMKSAAQGHTTTFAEMAALCSLMLQR